MQFCTINFQSLYFSSGKKSAAYVTNLSFLISKTHLDPSTGIRRKVIIELALLGTLAILMLSIFFLPSDERGGNLFRVLKLEVLSNSGIDCILERHVGLNDFFLFNYRTMHMPSLFSSYDLLCETLIAVLILPS